MATEKSALNPAQAEALKYTLLAGAGATGVGGLLALLANQTATKKPMKDLATSSPEMVGIPFPKAKSVANELEDDETEKMAKDNSWTGFFTGSKAVQPWQIPLFLPAMAAATIGGGALGYSKINELLKERRKQQMAEDVEDAEEEFNQALLGSYDPKKLKLHKAAMAKEVSDGLTKLASLLNITEKEAGVLQNISSGAHSALAGLLGWNKDDVSRMAGTIAGPLILGGLTVPAATAYLAYKYYKDRDKSKLLNDAAKARQIARLNENIPEPYVQIES